MRIAYIGIDLLFPALLSLVENNCEIVKIFTCETDNVTEFNTQIISYAKEYNIPYTLDRITKKDIKELCKNKVDAIICGGYYYRLPVVKDIPMLNIHPSLLPVGRGVWPMPLIIMRGHLKSGVTIHKIEEEFDTGDIVLQREFELEPKENHMTYMNKVCVLLKDMLKELISNFDVLYSSARTQGIGEYMKSPTEDDYTITDEMSIEEADLILRAFYGYECIYKSKEINMCIIKGRVTKTKQDGYEYLDLKNGYIEIAPDY